MTQYREWQRVKRTRSPAAPPGRLVPRFSPIDLGACSLTLNDQPTNCRMLYLDKRRRLTFPKAKQTSSRSCMGHIRNSRTPPTIGPGTSGRVQSIAQLYGRGRRVNSAIPISSRTKYVAETDLCSCDRASVTMRIYNSDRYRSRHKNFHFDNDFIFGDLAFRIVLGQW